MKNLFVKGFATASLLFLLAGTAFYFLPHHGCDPSESTTDGLVEKANSGDIDSIKALYYHNRSLGVLALAEHWALAGAGFGDAEMMKAYASLFRTFSDEKKLNLLSQLKRDANFNKCFLSYLESDAAGQVNCEGSPQRQ
jgi:hypothetical protein